MLVLLSMFYDLLMTTQMSAQAQPDSATEPEHPGGGVFLIKQQTCQSEKRLRMILGYLMFPILLGCCPGSKIMISVVVVRVCVGHRTQHTLVRGLGLLKLFPKQRKGAGTVKQVLVGLPVTTAQFCLGCHW